MAGQSKITINQKNETDRFIVRLDGYEKNPVALGPVLEETEVQLTNWLKCEFAENANVFGGKGMHGPRGTKGQCGEIFVGGTKQSPEQILTFVHGVVGDRASVSGYQSTTKYFSLANG